MTDSQNQFASWFNVNAVKNDSLYEPLAQEGSVCGVGVNLALVHDPPLHIKSDHYSYINIIDSIEPNTPAEKAGLRTNDIMLEVDGTNLNDGQTLYLPEDVADMTRGPEGSEVVVAVERDGKRVKFVLIREHLDVASSSPLSSPVRKMKPVTP
mmetsp:Transcript_10791/g.23899  ORF Transcript_10791/g.23899 Transcript_10791/m.23899 type:complete len:153 (+) Transcript_10791:44-502(+)